MSESIPRSFRHDLRRGAPGCFYVSYSRRRQEAGWPAPLPSQASRRPRPYQRLFWTRCRARLVHPSPQRAVPEARYQPSLRSPLGKTFRITPGDLAAHKKTNARAGRCRQTQTILLVVTRIAPIVLNQPGLEGPGRHTTPDLAASTAWSGARSTRTSRCTAPGCLAPSARRIRTRPAIPLTQPIIVPTLSLRALTDGRP